MHSHLCIHINGILLRASVMRIGVLNCAKKVILESKGFISIIYIRPVYFPWDYKYLSMQPYDPMLCLPLSYIYWPEIDLEEPIFTNEDLIPGFETGILYLCVSHLIYTLTMEQSAVGSAGQLRPGGADYRGSRIISLKAIIYYGAVHCRVGGVCFREVPTTIGS